MPNVLAGVEVASPTFGTKIGNTDPTDPDRPLSLQELDSQHSKLKASLRPDREVPSPSPSQAQAAPFQYSNRATCQKPRLSPNHPQRRDRPQTTPDPARSPNGNLIAIANVNGKQEAEGVTMRVETVEAGLETPFKVGDGLMG